eukprot:jgi/Orpsp1_1/1177600/evm.model.c7180000062083.1
MFRLLQILFCYILLIIYDYILLIHSKTINVSNENDIISGLNDNFDNIIIFNIENIDIKIYDNIIIEDHYNSTDNSLKYIYINGISNEYSILEFNNTLSKFIFSNENIEEIYLNNLTIYGNLEFINYQNVNINNVVLYGRMDFNNGISDNKLINIINFRYYGLSYDKLNLKSNNCINLYGNVFINNSYFNGNSSCTNNILSYDGENINSIKINESYFNGNYIVGCISIIDSIKSEISSSIFENSYKYKSKGGTIEIIESNFYINDCIFKNNISLLNGGVFYVYNSYDFEAEDITAYNSTSLEKGSFLYMYSTKNINTKGKIVDIFQYDTGNLNKIINTKGLIASIEGYSNLYIENFYGENLNGGNGEGAFTLNNYSSIEIKNIILNNIKCSKGGVLLTSENEEYGSFFKVDNGIFTNFYQFSNDISSSLIWSTNNIDISLESCDINNIFCRTGYFIYTTGLNEININNTIISNHESNGFFNLITCSGLIPYYRCKLSINNTIINNVNSLNSLITLENGEFTLNNSTISNIFSCLYSIRCNIVNDKYDESIADFGHNTRININNTLFEIIEAKRGFKARNTSYITINNSEIRYNSIARSIFYIDDSIEGYNGHYIINNCSLYRNFGYDGGVLHIKNINNNSSIIFNNSIFEKNYSLNNGGVIYSTSKLTYLYVIFNECIFEKNSGFQGDIAYSISKLDEPYFSNIDELRKIYNAFATNPVNLKLTDDSLKSLFILSGETISNEIY